jgi:hypothetical protein
MIGISSPWIKMSADESRPPNRIDPIERFWRVYSPRVLAMMFFWISDVPP